MTRKMHTKAESAICSTLSNELDGVRIVQTMSAQSILTSICQTLSSIFEISARVSSMPPPLTGQVTGQLTGQVTGQVREEVAGVVTRVVVKETQLREQLLALLDELNQALAA